MSNKLPIRVTRRSALGFGVAMAATLAVMQPNASSAQETVKLGALIPVTGGLQSYGEGSLQGLRLAVEQINNAGGVLDGRQIELIVGDTQTSPQPAVEAAQRLVSVEGVVAIVGALGSGNTMPVAQTVSAPNQIPQISNASTAPAITTLDDDDFLFRTTPSDAYQGVAAARLAAEAGDTNVAVLYLNNDYGEGLAQAFEEAMTAAGGTVTASQAFEPNQASYRSDLQVLANSGADALVLVAYPDDGGLTILRQALEEGLFDRFILTDGMKAEGLLTEIGGEYLEGAYGTAARAVESDASEVWREAFEAAYGEMPPVPYIDGAYDAAWILMLAIEKARSTDGTAIRDAIREVSSAPGEKVMPGEWEKAKELIAAGTDIDYVGAAGEHEFDENGDVSGTFEHWAILDGQIQSVAVFDPSE
jgi:branched-chain amino acid transport system substrate-binding protein